MVRSVSFIVALVALGVGLIIWHEPVSPTLPGGSVKPPAASTRDEQVKQPNQQWQVTQPQQLPDPGPLPASLQGASQSVRFAVDAQGHFQPASDSLELFEFYLAGVGEEPLKTVLLRIHRDIAGQLTEPALGEARDLLRRYLDYRLALMNLPPLTGQDVAALQERMTRTGQIRQQFFTVQEHALFFAEDELEDQRLLAQMASPQQRQEIEQAFQQRLTPEQRESRAQITRDAELYEQTEQLRSQGAPDVVIFQLREAQLGAQAAAELAALDRQRVIWNARVEAFSQERRRIMSSGLAPQDELKAIEQSLAAHFQPEERVRARALTE
jgi:lipase chaperone LimK